MGGIGGEGSFSHSVVFGTTCPARCAQHGNCGGSVDSAGGTLYNEESRQQDPFEGKVVHLSYG